MGPLSPLGAGVEVGSVELGEGGMLSVLLVEVAALEGAPTVPVPREPPGGKMPAGMMVDVVVLEDDAAAPVPMEPPDGEMPSGMFDGAAASWLIALEDAVLSDIELASCWGLGAAVAVLRRARMRGNCSSLMANIMVGLGIKSESESLPEAIRNEVCN